MRPGPTSRTLAGTLSAAMVAVTVLALAVPSSAEIESATPTSQTVAAGDTATVTVSLDSVGASCLSALTPPPGFTVLFSPTCTATAAAWTSVATITVADTTLPGTYAINILETPTSPLEPTDVAVVTITVDSELTTTVPEVSTTLPEVTTTLPEVTTTLPDVTITLPEVTTTLPPVSTTLPIDTKSSPTLPAITLPTLPGETTTTTTPGATTTTTTVAGSGSATQPDDATSSPSTTLAAGTAPGGAGTPPAAGPGPGGNVDETVAPPGPSGEESPLGSALRARRVIEGEGNREHLAGLIPASDPAAASPRPDSLAARLLSSIPELALGAVTGPLAVLLASLRVLLESWTIAAIPLAVGALCVPRWRTHLVRFTQGRLQALRDPA